MKKVILFAKGKLLEIDIRELAKRIAYHEVYDLRMFLIKNSEDDFQFFHNQAVLQSVTNDSVQQLVQDPDEVIFRLIQNGFGFPYDSFILPDSSFIHFSGRVKEDRESHIEVMGR